MFYASVRKNKQQVSAHYLETDEKHNFREHILILIYKHVWRFRNSLTNNFLQITFKENTELRVMCIAMFISRLIATKLHLILVSKLNVIYQFYHSLKEDSFEWENASLFSLNMFSTNTLTNDALPNKHITIIYIYIYMYIYYVSS